MYKDEVRPSNRIKMFIRKKSPANNKHKKSYFSAAIIAALYPDNSPTKEILLKEYQKEQHELRNKADYLEQRECDQEQLDVQL